MAGNTGPFGLNSMPNRLLSIRRNLQPKKQRADVEVCSLLEKLGEVGWLFDVDDAGGRSSQAGIVFQEQAHAVASRLCVGMHRCGRVVDPGSIAEVDGSAGDRATAASLAGR